MTSIRLTVGQLRLCVSAVVVFACVAGVATSPALAERGHILSSQTIGSPGSGPGQLKEPVGLAVNEATGMVYVADRGNNRVQWFDAATGQVEGEINGSGKLKNAKGEEFEGKEAGSGGLTDEEKTGTFLEPEAVAVDNSCKLHHLTEVSQPKTCKEEYPSNGDVYVIDSGHNVVNKYTAGGEYVGQITAKTLGVVSLDSVGGLVGVAVELDGDVVVSTYNLAVGHAEEGVYRLSDGVANALLAPGGPAIPFTFTGESGLDREGLAAVGGRVFVSKTLAHRDVSVWGLGGEFLGELFVGSVARAGLAAEACTGNVYVDEGEEQAGLVLGRFYGTGGSVESLSIPGGDGQGVAVDCLANSGSDVFVAGLVSGVVDVFVPELPGPPSIEEKSGFVSEVSTEGAKLSFTINPRSEPGEPATTYRFEYGPCPAEGSCENAAYGQSVEGSLPASYEATGVSVTVSGLAAGTRYHYRVRAHNSQKNGEEIVGREELVFSTQPSFAGGLLDGRGWELVSPPDKFGAQLLPDGVGVVQAAADGSALTYLASAATEARPAGEATNEQVLSRRSSAGWESCDIGLPHEYTTGPLLGVTEYDAFDSGLDMGVAQEAGRFSGLVSPEASEDTPYLAGLPGLCGQRPAYRPLVSGCVEGGPPCAGLVEEHADVHTGKPFGEEQECVTVSSPICGPLFEGSNASLSAVVVRAGPKTVLVERAGGETVPANALYEWYGGELHVVSVLPSGKPIGGAGGGFVNGLTLGTSYSSDVGSLRGAVSEDGSRVVWSEVVGNHHLFVWDRASERSVQVDTVQKEAGVKAGEGKVEPVFQFATGDGSKVFFTDPERLTANAGKEDQGRGDLYECEVLEEGTGPPKCALHDLTPQSEAGESANVLGQALGASGDAGTIYFVADGILSKNTDAGGQTAVKGSCETGGSASAQECNLYEWHEGTTELVAVLSGEDTAEWGGVGREANLAHLVGRVTPSGEWLAFMSDRSLTGYDNHDVHSGRPDEEAYLYNSNTHNLVCVSCNPTGERPNGFEYSHFGGLSLATQNTSIWGSRTTWLAATLPVWTGFTRSQAQYQSRYLDEDGRMFFNSSDGLVPRDTNEQEDVYEYEPAGVGSCTSEAPSYIAAEGGCLGLVSSGESPEESAFLDASENGNDVFFLTQSKLSKRDTDTALDVYDARVGGIEPPESKPVECEGDACQAPVNPPESLTPSSLTSNGVGNLLAPPAPGGTTTKTVVKKKPETRQQKLKKALKGCRKDRGKARRKICEKSARKRYGAVSRKATKGRVG